MKNPLTFFLSFSIICWWGSGTVIFGAENEQSVPMGTKLNICISTLPELKAIVSHDFVIPILRTDEELLKDNNLTLRPAWELSPVSTSVTFDAILTPLACLQFTLGGAIGTGWNIPIANGLARNQRGLGHQAQISTQPFDGFKWKWKTGGTFQLDLAALVPGDWNHVVLQTYHEINYQALSSVNSSVSWVWEADEGENRNGWNYYGYYVVGYQMPLAVDMIGILVESDLYLYDTPNRTFWGDDIARWKMAPFIELKLSDALSIAILCQFRTMRNFVNGTGAFGFYQDREVDRANPLSFQFYRAVASIDVKF